MMKHGVLRLTVALTLLSVLGITTRTVAEESAEKFEGTVTKAVEARYLLVKPEGYDPQKKYPLILFLHGRGESGDDLERVKIHGPFKKVAELGLDVLIAAPQCPENEWWDADTLAALTEHLIDDLPVDPDRVYLTGLSMGGGGTWALLAQRPDLFAAAVPICGWGRPAKADQMKRVPIWIFHGAKDNVVATQNSRNMEEALKAVGGNVRYTEYPEAGHDSWTETYNNPELYDWLLAQRRNME